MTRSRLVLPVAVVAAFVFGSMTQAGFSQGARTQPAAPLVVGVDFMKVAPERAAEYLRLEREVWMPLHREMIRRGQKRSWTLYGVQFPNGTGNEYGFVTINVYDSLSALDGPSDAAFRDIVAKALPRTSIDSMISRTLAGRQLVRGEVWRRLEHVE
jgi:hypothetical protein